MLKPNLAYKITNNYGLTITEAAEYLGVHRTTLSKYLVEVPADGDIGKLPLDTIPFRKIGKCVRIFARDILRYGPSQSDLLNASTKEEFSYGDK